MVKNIHGGKVLGEDEVRPDYLRDLDFVVLLSLTRLFNIVYTSGQVPLADQGDGSLH